MPASQANILYDLYETDRAETVRYALGRRTPYPLLVIGLNPSTADQHTRDQTLTRVEGFARRRAKSLIMCNLYPLRATDHDDLPDYADENLIAENLRRLSVLCTKYTVREIWAAWGDPIEKRPYLLSSLRQIHGTLSPHSPKWLKCGSLTKKGHPRHPSRLPYRHRFTLFNISHYLANPN